MPKLLVLGSEGFIGSHIVKYFYSIGWNVVGCDLSDLSCLPYKYFKISLLSNDIDEIFQNDQYDFCINAAGSGNVSYSVNFPLSDFEANTLSVVRLLDSLRKYSPNCKYLHISSAAVYGNPNELPIKESSSLRPVSPYGWHKLMSELACNEYSELYKLKTAIIRPFSVYGPGLKKQLFWDLYLKAKSGSRIELFGTGEETRDFIFISDLVNAVALIVSQSAFSANVFNVAGGSSTKIKTAAETFLDNSATAHEVVFTGNSKTGDPKNWKADVSSLISIGFSPKTTLNEGLAITYQWLESQVISV